MKIAHDICDKRNEGIWLNNLGDIFMYKKKHKEALVLYRLAKDIFTQIEDLDLVRTESNLKILKKEIGERMFEQLIAEVSTKEDEIVRKILEEIDK